MVLSAEINNVLSPSDHQANSTRVGGVDIEDLFTEKTSEAERRDLLERCLAHPRTLYGRCVYSLDNDVCDNQVVQMQFDDESTATMTMIATSKDTCARKTKVYGTKGQLDWDDSSDVHAIEHYDFLTGETNYIDYTDAVPSIAKREETTTTTQNEHIRLTGHGGSDYFLMDAFVEAVLRNDKSFVLTDVEDSLRSHVIVFAAEHARRTNRVVDVAEFCRENNIELTF